MVNDKHHRYRSWEHCYRFFQEMKPSGLARNRDDAAVRLAFYLASWGMYRGGSFLLQRDYTIHLAAIDCLCQPRWSSLWEREVGAGDSDDELTMDIVELRKCLGAAYAPFGEPTDTLATKIMLGTLACTPACDRFFKDGFRARGYPYSYFNRPFVERVLEFCRSNDGALRNAQNRIAGKIGTHYPMMKVVDMYFFQIGWECRRDDAEPGE